MSSSAAERQRRYYLRNRERILAQQAEYRAANPHIYEESRKRYYEENRRAILDRNKKYHTGEAYLAKKRIQNRRYYAANRDRICEQHKQYYRDNPEMYHGRYRRTMERYPEKVRERNARRRAREYQATPKWLTKEHIAEMQAIYAACPAGHHVDHIVPILGRSVCGLHVPWNLQILEAAENIRKSNKHPLECTLEPCIALAEPVSGYAIREDPGIVNSLNQ